MKRYALMLGIALIVMMASNVSAYTTGTLYSDNFEDGNEDFSDKTGYSSETGSLDGTSKVNGVYSYRVQPGNDFTTTSAVPSFNHGTEPYDASPWSESVLSFWVLIDGNNFMDSDYKYGIGIGYSDDGDDEYQVGGCNANWAGVWFYHDAYGSAKTDVYLCAAGTQQKVNGVSPLSDGLYFFEVGYFNNDEFFEVNVYDENMTLLDGADAGGLPASFNTKDDVLFMWSEDSGLWGADSVYAYFDDILYEGNTEEPAPYVGQNISISSCFGTYGPGDPAFEDGDTLLLTQDVTASGDFCFSWNGLQTYGSRQYRNVIIDCDGHSIEMAGYGGIAYEDDQRAVLDGPLKGSIEIKNCVFTDNDNSASGVPIIVNGGRNNSVHDNIINVGTNQDWGMLVQWPIDHSLVQNNELYSSAEGQTGMYVLGFNQGAIDYEALNVDILGNTISEFTTGINYATDDGAGSIIGNNISNTRYPTEASPSQAIIFTDRNSAPAGSPTYSTTVSNNILVGRDITGTYSGTGPIFMSSGINGGLTLSGNTYGSPEGAYGLSEGCVDANVDLICDETFSLLGFTDSTPAYVAASDYVIPVPADTTGFTASNMINVRDLDQPYVELATNFRITWLGSGLDFDGANFAQYLTYAEGEIGVGTPTPYTEDYAETFTQLFTDSTDAGLEITPEQDLSVTGFSIFPGQDGFGNGAITECGIKQSPSEVVVATTNDIVHSTGAVTFATPVDLTGGQAYYAYCGAEGSNYDVIYYDTPMSFPVDSGFIVWTGGYYGGPDDYANNILDISFEVAEESIVYDDSRIITLESANMPADVNTPAELTFYQVENFTSPYLNRDGEFCDDCTITSNQGGTIIFQVTGFSTYELLNGQAGGAVQETPTSSGGGTSRFFFKHLGEDKPEEEAQQERQEQREGLQPFSLFGDGEGGDFDFEWSKVPLVGAFQKLWSKITGLFR